VVVSLKLYIIILVGIVYCKNNRLAILFRFKLIWLLSIISVIISLLHLSTFQTRFKFWVWKSGLQIHNIWISFYSIQGNHTANKYTYSLVCLPISYACDTIYSYNFLNVYNKLMNLHWMETPQPLDHLLWPYVRQ
jgi:hypothetical protein